MPHSLFDTEDYQEYIKEIPVEDIGDEELTDEELMEKHSPERFEYAPGKFLKNVHPAASCFGRHCVVHNPSNHHMRSFPLHWRNDRMMFERKCPHGVGHPDPDHMLWYRLTYGDEMAKYEGIHGCDGCCR